MPERNGQMSIEIKQKGSPPYLVYGIKTLEVDNSPHAIRVDTYLAAIETMYDITSGGVEIKGQYVSDKQDKVVFTTNNHSDVDLLIRISKNPRGFNAITVA